MKDESMVEIKLSKNKARKLKKMREGSIDSTQRSQSEGKRERGPKLNKNIQPLSMMELQERAQSKI